jgi:predicted permease
MPNIMRSGRILLNRLRSLLRRSRIEAELEREIVIHLEQLSKEYRAGGMDERQARAAAKRAFGPTERIKENCRDTRRINLIEDFVRDLGYGLRLMRRSPGFTAAAILTLALGIGGNTALFQLLDNIVLRSLPVPEPERLVALSRTSGSGPLSKTSDVFTYPVFSQLRDNAKAAAHLIAFVELERPELSIGGQDEPPRNVSLVSPEFFSTLGAPAAIGRVFDATQSHAAATPEAVISHRLWRDRFRADTAVLGRPMNINGVPFTVIGVASASFRGVSPERAVDVWALARTAARLSPAGTAPNFRVLGRLAPGVSREQARSRLEALLSEIEQPRALGAASRVPAVRVHLEPGHAGYSRLREQFGRPLLVLMFGVALLLLLSCVNIATLLIARAVARQREFSVRMALGAGRGRLLRQMLVESLALALLGGASGFFAAPRLASSIVAFVPELVRPAVAADLGGLRVIGFALIITLLTSLLFGCWPAWRAAGMAPEGGLRAGGRGELGSRGGRRAGSILVALQVALSVPLLAGTGLFVRTLSNLLNVDPGFGTEHLLQATLDTRAAGYGRGQVGTLYRELLSRIGALPGVAAVTGVRNGFLTGGTTTGGMSLRGYGIDEVVFERADVGPKFFQTMAIPVISGRDFTEADTNSSTRKVVMSESFARRYLAGRQPIGERIGSGGELEVVAVVKDLRFSGLRHSPAPMLYFAALQTEPDRLSALEVRTVTDPTALANAIRREIESINRRLLIDVKTMERQRQDSLAQERMLAFVAGGFGVMALMLVCIGLYGVISRAAVQRTSEFGLRIALGSSRTGILLLIIRDTVRPVLAGLLLGIVSSWALARIWQANVSALLYGLSVTDIPTILVATGMILAVAGSAALVPAARAAQSDPLTALRQE